MSLSIVRLAPVAAVFAAFAVACSASSTDEEGPGSVTGDDEVVSARLACTVTGDPCEHGSDGDLEACVDAIVLRQASSGKVRLEVTRRSTVGNAQGSKPMRLTSDAPASLTGARVSAQWDGGEHHVQLVKKGNGYEGQLTLEQDFPFPIKCTSAGTANAGCQHGGKAYAPGQSFPSTDGCNTCSCMAGGGIACTELACRPIPTPGCKVGDQTYARGESFKSPFDRCNTCTCGAGGSIACTELFCP